MAVGPHLQRLRQRTGLSVRGMARLLGFAHGSGYQYWEQGAGADRNYMAPDLAIKMAALIGMGDPPISRDDIEQLFPRLGARSSARSIPVVSWVAAGDIASAEDPYEKGDGGRMIAVCGVSETCLALEVSGSSMNRVAPPGSMIVVDYGDRDLTSGRCYVVKLSDGATFKRYRADPARFEPDSTEPHDTIFVGPDDEVTVVGRVVQVITQL